MAPRPGGFPVAQGAKVYSGPARERLLDLLRRFVREGDDDLSDVDFVKAVYGRFLQSREDYILDPSE